MEFDAKRHFPTKEGFGDVAISVPDMQAKIARLQAEVERLANELEASERGSLGRKLQRDIAQVQRDRAWNDALDDAAQIADEYEQQELASAIRDLKRT